MSPWANLKNNTAVIRWFPSKTKDKSLFDFKIKSRLVDKVTSNFETPRHLTFMPFALQMVIGHYGDPTGI